MKSSVLCEHAWGEGFFHSEIIHLFVMSCSFVINDFLSVMEVYTQKMERKQRQNISMLKWFSLNLSFKHYTAKSLWKAHRDSAVLFYLKVLQTVGSHACVVFGAECGCVFVRDSDVTLPHLKWNVSVWFHASRRNLNVFSVLGYK